MRFLIFISIFLFPAFVFAQEIDTDGDGLSDDREINFYYTDPDNADTDGDGHDDNTELINGYSPHFAGKRIIEVDQDDDGLNDGFELALKSGIKIFDTDGDGIADGEEFKNGFDPSSKENKKLEKRIEIDTKNQRLKYFLGPVRLNEFLVSTGAAATPTPKGNFAIQNKFLRPWSSLASLWMPYWMAFNGPYGIHELPEWPGGIKEGANHLGIPVSHGCVRLPVGAAEELYNWADIGTPVIVY